MPLCESFPDREPFDSWSIAKKGDGLVCARHGARGCLQRAFKSRWFALPPKLGEKSLARNAAVGRAARYPREGAARPNDRIEQPSSGFPVAILQTVGDERFHSEMMSQRPKD